MIDDNSPQPLGSFGTGSTILGGGGGHLAAAIQRRAPALNQASPASAIFQPSIQQPQNPDMPNRSPMSMVHPQPMQQQPGQPPIGGQPMPPTPQPEHNIILEALTNRLKHISKKEMMAMETSQGTQQNL